ncbi:MAG TPA: hypothetical protein VE617_14160 [Propionibacteriaceae bacterium]|nr:hypothetical protein [Propionibacteriaceae bacterium]
MTDTAIPAPTRSRSVASFLLRRWPTALAIGLEVVSWGIGPERAGQILPLLPSLYVVAAVIRRRGASWPILIVSAALLFGLQLQSSIDPTVAILALATAVAVGGLFRRSGRGELLIQTGGLVVFGGLALVGLLVAPEVARYVLAAGWFGHGVWDLVHLRRDAVVSRSYAEWCGVLDVLIAVELVFAQQ